jgi:cytochrome c peroxidase
MKLIDVVLCAALGVCLAACHSEAPPSPPSPPVEKPTADYAPMKRQPSVPELTALGRAMFHDTGLSASGRSSCASCHDPDNAYSPSNRLAVQLGGNELTTPGTRAAPSLRYIQNIPPFTEHYHDDDGDDSTDAGPTGGYNWDGRARSAHEQARGPLLSPREMGNKDDAAVVARLRGGALAGLFRKTFGDDIFERPQAAMQAALMALEVFQESPADFYPYTSKYDAFLRKQTALTVQEARGLALFEDENKGNCASCHVSKISQGGAFPQFTDYGLINLGVPRNRKLALNANPEYFDLGLCGPDRTDLKDHREYCGSFKTPSLRNVALRKVYFHNGGFDSLEQVVRFYAQRDTAPEKWYPKDPDGSVHKYDDQPRGLDANVNMEAPFGGKPGQKPVLNEREIADIVAFLKTLTDGYSTRTPSAAR